MEVTQKFQYGLIKASKSKEMADERGENGFNVFGALKLGEKENAHSDFIAYLLNAKIEHNQKLFLDEFLAKLQKENLPSEFFEKLEFDYVEREQATRNINKNRRVDILLRFNDKFILIENKITADDQDLQVKDYITNTLKEKTEDKKTIPPQNILLIYLHPNSDETPSDNSLGDWQIKENFICDKNDKMQSYYFKMDYFWIKEWLEVCVYRLCKEQRERGKSGFSKIIFGVEQYIELLQNEQSILDEYKESNAVLEFIMPNENYQNMALTIMLDEKPKDLYEIVANSWGEISWGILKNFYEKVKLKFENDEVKIKNGKKTEVWIAERTDKDISIQGGHILFYDKKYKDKETCCYLRIGLHFDGKDLVKPKFTMGWSWRSVDDKMTKKFKQAVEYWEKEYFPSLDKAERNEFRVLGGKGWYYKFMLENIESKGQEKFAFLNWIFSFENLDEAVKEFIEKFKEFAECEPIARTRMQVDDYIKKHLS